MSRSEAPAGTKANPDNLLVAFEGTDKAAAWQPIGDPIMGGQSEGRVSISEGGVGEFHGTVRADNGGGFASVKRDLPAPVNASGFEGIEFLARGDGRTYKVGLRNSTNRNRVVYQQAFTPEQGTWTLVRLSFRDFVPTWRGRIVSDAAPLNSSQLASLSVFVSGGQYGDFCLRMQSWFLYTTPAAV
ncbi:MAG: CIA30 family protein [Pseudomonadota bacterium]